MNLINPQNGDTFTLHVRLTKFCNADCSYCSSYQDRPDKRMSLENYKKALIFITKKISELNLGGKRKRISIQYIGGEVLTLPMDYINNIVNITRNNFINMFDEVVDGCQSNLISSPERFKEIYNLFNGNIGTSYDDYTNQRTIKGDANKYKRIFIKNITQNKRETGLSIPGIIVLDDKMAPHIHNQINDLTKRNINITIRPIFNGGIDVNKISSYDLTDIYNCIFDNWFLKQNNIIEPFYSLTMKRINSKNINLYSGCPFQFNCAQVSLNLEPNGDIFLCQDMADSSEYSFGNALEETWDYEKFNALNSRHLHLDKTCLNCSYFKECQGGCLKESLEQGNGIFGKSQYCETWKSIFKKIDEMIHNKGIDQILVWLNKINH